MHSNCLKSGGIFENINDKHVRFYVCDTRPCHSKCSMMKKIQYNNNKKIGINMVISLLIVLFSITHNVFFKLLILKMTELVMFV